MAKARNGLVANPGQGARAAELTPGASVRGVFVVKKKVRREQPNGAPFLLFQFADRSGVVNGVLWEGVETAEHAIATGDLAHVQGDVQLYQNTRQIRVRAIERADPARYDLSAFLPHTERDREELYARVLEAADSIGDPWVRQLCSDLFRDVGRAAAFRHAPAGKGWHHATVGGLLEHVVCMLDLGEVLARQHPDLDRDLLVAGILLHDVGKIEEITFRSHIEYTDAGRLLGHLVQGALLVSRVIDGIAGFPEELRLRLLHVIIGHHGSLDRGSPKPPMTLEAVAVHLLDQLDSQVQGVEQVVARPSGDDGWTEHVKLLDRFFYRGRPGSGTGPAED